MGNRFQNFMAGRNGADRLGMVQIAASVVLNLLARRPGWEKLSLFSSALLVWALFRILSRNLPARQRENALFVTAIPRLRAGFKAWQERQKHRKEYKFYRCVGCSNWLRVPKGKGRIQITCPRCGHRFSRKT